MPHGKVPTSDDEAFDNGAICKRFGVSRWAILSWREKHGFPPHDFYVGPRGFTWKSTIDAWVASRPRESAAAGKKLPKPHEAEHAHQAA